MTHAGAKRDTALQLQKALGLENVPLENINVAIDNFMKSMKV